MKRIFFPYFRFIYCLALFFPLVLSAEEENQDISVPKQTLQDLKDDTSKPLKNANDKNLNWGQKWQKQMEEERSKEYKPLGKSRAEYYKYAAPKNPNQPDYFKKGHPMKPAPLKKNPLR